MIPYKTVAKEVEVTEIVKKSKFIARVKPVSTQEEAEQFIDKIKKEHFNASHNVPAYIVGLRGETQKFSDDGEPSGTAGMPILDVLKGEGLVNLCVVVTRYFGGTLLGRGGLVRAYGGAAKSAVISAGIVHMIPAYCVQIRVNYSLSGKVQNELLNLGVEVTNIEYTDEVGLTIRLLPNYLKQAKQLIQEITANNFGWEIIEEVYKKELVKER